MTNEEKLEAVKALLDSWDEEAAELSNTCQYCGRSVETVDSNGSTTLDAVHDDGSLWCHESKDTRATRTNNAELDRRREELHALLDEEMVTTGPVTFQEIPTRGSNNTSYRVNGLLRRDVVTRKWVPFDQT